ncbi:MAG: hypothetical protein AB2556_22290, partial [Candidatus Thiodiazotropha sp.]
MGYKELTQYQIKLSPGFLLQDYVPVAYFILSTGPTNFYFALNPFPTVSAGSGNFFTFADFSQMNL